MIYSSQHPHYDRNSLSRRMLFMISRPPYLVDYALSITLIASEQNKMEYTLEKCYKYFEFIGTYPYHVRLIPDTLDYEIVLKKGWICYRWKVLIICSILHMLKSCTGFLLSFHLYMDNKDFLRLMFHCVWSISFVIILSQQFAFIFCKVEVIQLGNDTVVCMRKFEKGALLANFVKASNNIFNFAHVL